MCITFNVQIYPENVQFTCSIPSIASIDLFRFGLHSFWLQFTDNITKAGISTLIYHIPS